MEIDNGNIYACDGRYETIIQLPMYFFIESSKKGNFLGSTFYKSVSKKIYTPVIGQHYANHLILLWYMIFSFSLLHLALLKLKNVSLL